MAIVGIDLGTTNSLIGVYEDGAVKLIPNRFGRVLTPSVVAETEDGIVVGETAKSLQTQHPEKCVAAFKRYMGTDKQFRLGRNLLDAQALSSLVLKALVEDAALYLGEPVEKAVISVPAYFNDKQKRATLEAARMAGLEVERLINEPTAAALAYCRHEKSEATVIAVVDLGGGTFDVSILDVFDDIIEVRAVAGDNYFGGEDFDNLLVTHLAEAYGIELDSLSPVKARQLKHLAEKAKIELTGSRSTEVIYIEDDVPHAFTLAEEQYEVMMLPLIDKLRLPLQKALKDSRFKLTDIDDVILVGGSTRMPLVKKHVAKLFGAFPLARINPDEVVAVGACIAAEMHMRHRDFKDTVLTDVCPFTLGTTVLKSHGRGRQLMYDPIIERNMTVPVSRVRRYANADDYQQYVSIDVYQGDAYKIEDNIKLDELKVSIPRKKAGMVSIDVRFTYDINGILEVETTVLDTGATERRVVINANEMEDAAIAERMAAIAHLKIHPRDNEINKQLVARLEQHYELNLGEVRHEIAQELLRFSEVLNTQEEHLIEEAVERVQLFLAYLES